MSDGTTDRAAKWCVVDSVNGRVLATFGHEDDAWAYWRALPHPQHATVMNAQDIADQDAANWENAQP